MRSKWFFNVTFFFVRRLAVSVCVCSMDALLCAVLLVRIHHWNEYIQNSSIRKHLMSVLRYMRIILYSMMWFSSLKVCVFVFGFTLARLDSTIPSRNFLWAWKIKWGARRGNINFCLRKGFFLLRSLCASTATEHSFFYACLFAFCYSYNSRFSSCFRRSILIWFDFFYDALDVLLYQCFTIAIRRNFFSFLFIRKLRKQHFTRPKSYATNLHFFHCSFFFALCRSFSRLFFFRALI